MTTMVLSHYDLLELALRRIANAGLKVSGAAADNPGRTWNLPVGAADQLQLSWTEGRPLPHDCSKEREPEVPPFLVVPLRGVYRVDTMREYSGKTDFTPYWVRGARLCHFEWQYPRDGWREATLTEIVCAIAQNERFGSIRTTHRDRYQDTDTIEACRWSTSRVCLHKSWNIWWGYQHHRMFVKEAAVPHCCTTRDLVEA